jgi:hypothetical protein
VPLKRLCQANGRAGRFRSPGRELFYRVGDALMAVDVTTSPRLTVATPRLFEEHYEPSISLYANYSTIDGPRFVM